MHIYAILLYVHVRDESVCGQYMKLSIRINDSYTCGIFKAIQLKKYEVCINLYNNIMERREYIIFSRAVSVWVVL